MKLLDGCMVEVLHAFYGAVNTLYIALDHVRIVVVIDWNYAPGIHQIVLCGVHKVCTCGEVCLGTDLADEVIVVIPVK
jgi:hypothetical protein